MVLGTPVSAGQAHVAVAANFTEPSKEIAALFKAKTGHEAVLIFGASALFIRRSPTKPHSRSSAPDSERPKLAVDNGFAVPDSLFTYAIGKLALWSRVVDVTKATRPSRPRLLETGHRQSQFRALWNRRIETLKALNL